MSGSIWQIQRYPKPGFSWPTHPFCLSNAHFFLCFSSICCADPLFCLHLVCKHPHFAGWSRSSLFVEISSFVGCNRLLCRLLLRFCWLSNVPIISWKPSCRAPGLPSDPNGRDDCGLEHLHLPTPDFFAPKQEDIQALASRRGNLRWQWSSWSYQGPVDGEFISGDGPSLSSSICVVTCNLPITKISS